MILFIVAVSYFTVLSLIVMGMDFRKVVIFTILCQRHAFFNKFFLPFFNQGCNEINFENFRNGISKIFNSQTEWEISNRLRNTERNSENCSKMLEIPLVLFSIFFHSSMVFAQRCAAFIRPFLSWPRPLARFFSA